jgi:hypothetical protein
MLNLIFLSLFLLQPTDSSFVLHSDFNPKDSLLHFEIDFKKYPKVEVYFNDIYETNFPYKGEKIHFYVQSKFKCTRVVAFNGSKTVGIFCYDAHNIKSPEGYYEKLRDKPLLVDTVIHTH